MSSLLRGVRLHEQLVTAKALGVLQRNGITLVEEVLRLTETGLCMVGLTVGSAVKLLDAVTRLSTLPPGRLRQIGYIDEDGQFQLPVVPIEAIARLCYARSVDQEIGALVWDPNQRNSEAVLARWGCRPGGALTLDAVGEAFRITRERVRQIVQQTEDEVSRSRVTLPLASSLVHDLDQAGGALPQADYLILLKNGLIETSAEAVSVLPELARLGCVPRVSYHEDVDLWTSAAGNTEWIDSGKIDRIRDAARQTGRPLLRRFGAVPLAAISECSPFGAAHALRLIRLANTRFVRAGDWAFAEPARDSALLRLCRKVLAVTTPILLADLFAGLMHSSRMRGLSEEALRFQLARSTGFHVEGELVSRGESFADALSPAERIGVDLIDRNGGILIWSDFARGMSEAGVSLPMAAVVLKKPFIRQIGPGLYALRGRQIDDDVRQRALRRRRKLTQANSLIKVEAHADGTISVTWSINDFTQQGVLPAPRQLRGVPRHWDGIMPDSSSERIRVANGFVWPLYRFFRKAGVRRGDVMRASFDPHGLTVRFEHQSAPRDKPQHGLNEAPVRSREEQILRELFKDY